MKKILLLAILFSLNTNAQFLKDIFKYSTLYASYYQSNALQPTKTFYVTQGNELQVTTPRVPNDATYTFGLRKLAFFDYEMPDKVVDFLDTYADRQKVFDSILLNKLEGFFSDLGWSLNLNPYVNALKSFEI